MEYGNLFLAKNALILNESSKRWIKEEEVIDDITAVLIFFED